MDRAIHSRTQRSQMVGTDAMCFTLVVKRSLFTQKAAFSIPDTPGTKHFHSIASQGEIFAIAFPRLTQKSHHSQQ
jgi:hypothetical protein